MRTVVKEHFKLIVLVGRCFRNGLCQLKTEGRQQWPEHSLCVIQLNCRDRLAIAHVKKMKFLPVKNNSTATVHTDHSFLSVKKALLK